MAGKLSGRVGDATVSLRAKSSSVDETKESEGRGNNWRWESVQFHLRSAVWAVPRSSTASRVQVQSFRSPTTRR